MIDYAENLCEAMKIIFEKQIKQLSFDITIDATVVDATNAKNGMYVVSHDGATFTAYSTDTSFKEKDVVMVTVPQGNYDNQKMIIGKQVDKNKEEKPITYQSSFSQITNLSGNLIYGNIEEKGLLANGGIGKSENEQTAAQIIPIKELKSSDNTLSEEYQSNGYTRIGLRADFSTWLNEFNVVSGNYGLILTLKFKNPDVTDSEENSIITAIYTFDSSEFFGDIYNFETYYNQEAIFDISDYSNYPIQSITLEAYQKDNFKVSDGSDLSYENEFFDNSFKPSDNIFIKDPFICLGTAIGEFKKDTANIMTTSASIYNNSDNPSNDIKNLKLKWTHQDLNSKDIYVVQNDNIPINYEIRWYKFKLGASSPDKFMDAHWIRFYGCKPEADEYGDYCLTQEEINNNENLQDIATNKINVNFQPNRNNQTEQLRVVILRKDENNNELLVAQTPIITFNNNQQILPDVEYIDANALGIQFDDTEKGKYYYYDKTGKKMFSKEKNPEHILKAVFKNNTSLEYKEDLSSQPYTSIKWIFPKTNTMIIPLDPGGKNNLESQLDQSIENNISPNYTVNINENNYEILFENENAKSILETITYKIDDNFSFNKSRNTVYLEVVVNGQTYISSVTMFFGIAGTSGSDYTLVVYWGENQQELPVFDINNNSDNYSLKGTVKLLDLYNEEVTLNSLAVYSYNLISSLKENSDLGLNCQSDDSSANHSNFIISRIGNNNISMDDLYILEIKLTGFGDYDLITKCPIALKNSIGNITINSITGTTMVRYASDGTITLDDKDPYSISFQNNGIKVNDKEKGSWRIVINEKVNSNFLPELIEINKNGALVEAFIQELKDLDLFTSLLYMIPDTEADPIKFLINKINTIIEDENQNEQTLSVYPNNMDESSLEEKLKDADKNKLKKLFLTLEKRYEGQFYSSLFKITEPILSPPSIYFKDIPCYGVQYLLNDDLGNGDTVLYTQPIYVYQDNYPSKTINQWNGRDLILDEDKGTIVANGFSAGRKEDDNTFTGVMIGDWSRTEAEDDSITTNTGIYGFHQGAMSYAFKDDGKAFIGKDGAGRIEFDGNKGIIESANFNLEDQVGSQFNLQQGSIFLFGNQIATANTYSLILNTDINNKLPFFRVGRQRNLQYITENIAQSFIDEYNQAVDSFIEIYNQQKDIIKFANTFLNINDASSNSDYSIFGEFITWYKDNYSNDNLLFKVVKTSELFSNTNILTPWSKIIYENQNYDYIANSDQQTTSFSSTDQRWLQGGTSKEIIEKYILYLYNALKNDNSIAENIREIYNLENNDFYNGQIRCAYLDLSQRVEETLSGKYYFRYQYAGSDKYYYIPIKPNKTTNIIFSHRIKYTRGQAIIKTNNTNEVDTFYGVDQSYRIITSFNYQYHIQFNTSAGGKITYTTPSERLGIYKIFDYLINEYDLSYNIMNDKLENSLNNISIALNNIKNNLTTESNIKDNFSSYIKTFEFYKNGDEENKFNLQLFEDSLRINTIKNNIDTSPENIFNFSQTIWSNHLIELTKNGGYITSKDYRPTITAEDLSRDYIRPPTQDQGVISLSQNSSGMKGFIIDLTNNRIVLGNNSAIIGYQTQHYQSDLTASFRKFTISTGANFQGYDAFGRDILTSSSNDDGAYFIKATNGATEIFSIKWNGYVLCETLRVHSYFYFGTNSNRVQDDKIAGVYDPQGTGNKILQFCDSNGNILSNIHVLCY